MSNYLSKYILESLDLITTGTLGILAGKAGRTERDDVKLRFLPTFRLPGHEGIKASYLVFPAVT